jgi:PleD family two-component response regulator
MASVGETRAQGEESASRIVIRADVLLYRSKATGRNCCSFA